MNKYEFLAQLRKSLETIPEEDARASVDYYAEMIDDRMEEGLSEEEAVAAIGDVKEIARNILAETPAEQKKPRKISGWVVALLVLGAPVWLSLLIAVASVVFSAWVSLWSVVISLYAVTVALGASCVGCLLAGVVTARLPGGLFVGVGGAMVCAGLCIGVFLLSNLAAKGMVALTKLTWKGIQRCFNRKEQSV